MRISTLETLESVLRLGSFVAASKEMNLTPSAVSMQMKQLEQYLGKQLFDRSGLQVRPTEAACEVVEMMHVPLRRFKAYRNSSSHQVAGTYRLGIIESLLAQVLPGVLSRLKADYPGVILKPVRGRSAGLISQLKSGDIDAALVAQPLGSGGALMESEVMMRRKFVLIAPPGSTATSLPSLFGRYDWIRYDRNTASGRLASRFVQEQLGEVRSSLELDSNIAILAVVSAGLGVAVTQPHDPAQMISHPVRVVRLGRAAPSLPLSFVSRKADTDDRGLAAIRDAMRSVLSAKGTLDMT